MPTSALNADDVLLGLIDTRIAVLDPAIAPLLRAVWDQDRLLLH